MSKTPPSPAPGKKPKKPASPPLKLPKKKSKIFPKDRISRVMGQAAILDELPQSSAPAHSTHLPPASTGLTVMAATVKTLQMAMDEQISVDFAVGVLKEQMAANTHYYGPSGQIVQKPDGKTRLAAVELWAAYKEGRPVERKIIEHHNLDSMEDLQKKLAASPALCEAFMKMILDANALREGKKK